MKIILKLASFNVENPNMKHSVNIDDEMQALASLVEDEDIDVLCCQEMLIDSVKVLSKYLPDYFIVGKNRYGSNFFSKNILILKKYNEATPIVSRKKIVTTRHHRLPWIPKSFIDMKNAIEKHSLTPRVLTEAKIELVSGNVIKIFNTHLDKGIVSVQQRQLNFIRHLVKTTYPLVLTGDFNMGLDNQVFQEFVKDLEKCNMKRILIDTNTLKRGKRNAIDHIFVPSDWHILEYRVVDNSISDHYMILVKVEIDI